MKFVFFFSLFQSYNPELKRQKLFVLTPVQQKKKTEQNKTKHAFAAVFITCPQTMFEFHLVSDIRILSTRR